MGNASFNVTVEDTASIFGTAKLQFRTVGSQGGIGHSSAVVRALCDSGFDSGDVPVSPDGSYAYDPTVSATLQALAVDETVNDAFAYSISDGNGGTATATVMIEVIGVNDAPIAIECWRSSTPVLAAKR